MPAAREHEARFSCSGGWYAPVGRADPRATPAQPSGMFAMHGEEREAAQTGLRRVALR
jgi:hypothetical protein